MKKYSKYNVAADLAVMCNYADAIKQLNTGKINADNLHELEARIKLYCAFFKDYLVTAADKAEFKVRKDNILSGFSTENLVEYEANVRACVESLYYDAVAEFQNRITNISPSSTDGKKENPVAFDLEALEKDTDYAYPMTRFAKLTNRPINRSYKCNDEGVYVYSKKSLDWVRASDAITIKSLPVDYENKLQYIELEYYDPHNGGKVATITIPVDELSKSKFEVLQNAGIVVDNPKMLIQYLNDLRSINHKTKKITYMVAANSYDFVKDASGAIDYSMFVGIDADAQIIKKSEFFGIDKSIAQRKGTLEGFIEFLTEVSKGYYELDFQLMVAASLVGVTQSVVNGITNMTAPICIFASGKTSIGKNLLAAICNNIWCAPTENSLRITSASSVAYMNAEKNHLGVLPLVMPDVQDLYNKYGAEEFVNMIFDHSNGMAGGKCFTTGSPRPDMKWKCPFITFGEAALLNTFKINGGASARVLIIDLNYNTVHGQQYLTKKNPKDYWSEEQKNYGVYGPAYIEVIKKKDPKDVRKRFAELAKEYCDLGVQDKQANILSLLTLTLEVLREAKMLPSTWKEADSITILNWTGVKVVKDPTDIMYEEISSHVFKDASYVPSDDKYLTVDAPKMGRSEADIYAERSKAANAIRGRLYWQRRNAASGEWEECKKGQRERTLLLIGNQELQQLFKYIETEYDVKGFAFDKKRWLENGWLLKGNDGDYLQRDTFKISVSRPHDSKNKERYYAIVLKEN